MADKKARLAKLAKAKDELTQLSKNLIGAKEVVTLAKQKAHISGRLSKLAKAGKLSPAEMKKVNLTKLAKLPKEALETVIESFEVREPVINPRQHGSTAAVEVTTMAKQVEEKQVKKLRAETRAHLRKLGAKLAESPEDKELAAEPEEREEKLSEAPEKKLSEKPEGFAAHMSKLAKCLEDGDVDGAKAAHAEMSKHLEEGDSAELADGEGEEGNEETEEATSDLQQKVDELSTGLARVAGMVSELMDAEGERAELEEGSEDDESELSEGEPEDEDEKKKLAESEDEEKKKKLAAEGSEDEDKKQEEQA